MLLETFVLCTTLVVGEQALPETAPLPDELESALPSQEALRENERKLWLARRLFRARDYETVIKVCEDILRTEPHNHHALILRQQSEKWILDARRKRLEREETIREDLAIDNVAIESRIPEEPLPVPRPKTTLRSRGAMSPEMQRMDELLSQKIDRLNFIDVDLDYFLNTLFKTTGVNIIADQSLLTDKRITIHAVEIELRDILDFITRVHDDLSYTVTPRGVWMVAKDKPILEPRVYPLNTGLVSFGEMSTRGNALSAQGSGVIMAGNQGGRRGQQQQQPQTQGEGKSYLEEVLDWMSGWTDLWPDGSQYYIDRKSNSLVVLTTPEMHEKIANVLDIIDTPPIQVLIRTKFIEVSTTDQFDLGFSFDMMRLTDEDGNPIIPEDRRMGFDSGTGVNLGVGTGEGFNLVYSGFTTNPQFTSILRMLEKDSRAKLLSAPQILALNNQKASINLSTQFEVPTYETASSTVVGNNQTTTIPTAFVPTGFEPLEVGFFLEVTPSVGHDLRHIVLELHPLVNDVEGGTDRFMEFDILTAPEAGEVSGQKVLRPVIKSREVATRLVIEDGGVVVLGGLMRSKKEKIIRRVPILGYIPIIGLLFRSQSDTVERSNLFIVVQANIITPGGARYEKPDAVFPAEVGGSVGSSRNRSFIFDYSRKTEAELSSRRYPASER